MAVAAIPFPKAPFHAHARSPPGRPLSRPPVLDHPPSLPVYRRAVALALRSQLGLSAKQIAACTGQSVASVKLAGSRALREGAGVLQSKPVGGRFNANMTPDEEREFLEPFLEKARAGGILEVGPVHRALMEKLGRPVHFTTAYRLLARHGWRKVAPRPRHPKADAAAQEEWKKNSRKRSPSTPPKPRRKAGRGA